MDETSLDEQSQQVVTPGEEFHFAATAPARVMMMFIQRGDGAAALNAVEYSQLVAAFHDGVARATRRVGVKQATLRSVLPETETHAAAHATIESQSRAVAVWNQHHGGLGQALSKLVGAVVEVHLGIPLGSGIGDALASAGSSMLQDARMNEPVNALIASLRAYDHWLSWCANVIDTDAGLVAARSRTMWRRRIALVVALSMLVLLAMVAWRTADQWWPF